jgi:hypothetical protein
MATISKFPRQLAPTVGQCVAATGVKFWPKPSSALGEKVASGLVWRFGTFDCVSDNLAYFKDGLGNSGSFLDVGSHRFYIAKPFPEEVTNVLDPLCDIGSDCSESSDLCTMVEVLALEDGGGGDLPRTARPPLERPPQQEQDLPPPERDVFETAIIDLRAPLDLTADLVKLSEDLERMHRNLLKEAISIEDTAQGFTPAGRWSQSGGTSSSMRPRAGRGAEPGSALGAAASCQRQAYLQHTHEEPPCCALHHLQTGRTVRRGLAGEASPAPRTPGRRRSVAAGDGAARRGERHTG